MFVGPGDLGLRLKIEKSESTLEDAYKQVAAACKKYGKAWGCPAATPEVLKHRQMQGGQLLNHGGDFGAIMNMLKTCAAAFEGLDQ
jgi:2-keto-3-deoxy-L-rhamnonate aldolase RhmA